MIHVFCPSFSDFNQDYSFETCSFDDVVLLLSRGYWMNTREENKRYKFCDAEGMLGDNERTVWRNGWPGPVAVLNNFSPLRIPRDVCQKRLNWSRPMQKQDMGVIFRGAGPDVDFRSVMLRPDDFEYYLVRPICREQQKQKKKKSEHLPGNWDASMNAIGS